MLDSEGVVAQWSPRGKITTNHTLMAYLLEKSAICQGARSQTNSDQLTDFNIKGVVSDRDKPFKWWQQQLMLYIVMEDTVGFIFI